MSFSFILITEKKIFVELSPENFLTTDALLYFSFLRFEYASSSCSSRKQSNVLRL